MPVSCALGASKWPMSLVPQTSLTPMTTSDYHKNMAHKSSQQRFKAPLGRGGQWPELTITLRLLAPSPWRNPSGAWFSRCRPGKRATVWGSYRWTSHGNGEGDRSLSDGTDRRAIPWEKYDCTLDALGTGADPQSTLSMQVIDGGAWVEQWKRFYRPFKLGKRLVIRPPWEPYTAAADELLLTLNPGQAFGTGLHATTQLCLTSLETIIGKRPGVRLLDVGCGSGILSLAGVLFGVRRAVGIDVDRLAVWVRARQCAVEPVDQAGEFCGRLLGSGHGPFDIVVANILLEPILAMLKPLHTAIVPGGTVVLSGILSAEVPQLRADSWHTDGASPTRHPRKNGLQSSVKRPEVPCAAFSCDRMTLAHESCACGVMKQTT